MHEDVEKKGYSTSIEDSIVSEHNPYALVIAPPTAQYM
jgi:hypothetical protein